MQSVKWSRWLGAAVPAALAAWLFARAARLGLDANWDLRNYHLYDPFALLHGKWARDLAPAQQQSFHPPLLDLPFYLLFRRVRSVAVLNVVLAVPHVAAVLLAYALARRLLGGARGRDQVAAGMATLVGATGAATLPVLASTMSDMAAVDLVLLGLLLLIPLPPGGWRPGRLLYAGALTGAAVGLRLTFGPVALGLAAMVLLPRRAAPVRRRVRDLLVLAGGGVAGALGSGGWWYLRLWRRWGSPLFPYENNLFHSPWAPPITFFDPLFLPHGWGWLTHPLRLAGQVGTAVTELPARDPRIPLALLAAGFLLRRRDGAASLGALAITAFVVWEARFSVLRYLSVVELLSGLLIAAALARWDRRAMLPGLAALLLGCAVWTRYPAWERLPPGARIAVAMPILPPDAMVLMLDESPASYLAVFQPPAVRFVAANNNVVSLRPDRRDPALLARVVAMVAAHPGPLWGIDMPEIESGRGDAALAFYGLRRAECDRVRTDLDGSLIRLCRLDRVVSRPASS